MLFEANLDQSPKILEISEVFIGEVFLLGKSVIRSFNLSNSYLRKLFLLLVVFEVPFALPMAKN